MKIFNFSIVIGVYGKWYNYIIPKRLTLTSNPPIYKWLWWNFGPIIKIGDE